MTQVFVLKKEKRTPKLRSRPPSHPNTQTNARIGECFQGVPVSPWLTCSSPSCSSRGRNRLHNTGRRTAHNRIRSPGNGCCPVLLPSYSLSDRPSFPFLSLSPSLFLPILLCCCCAPSFVYGRAILLRLGGCRGTSERQSRIREAPQNAPRDGIFFLLANEIAALQIAFLLPSPFSSSLAKVLWNVE